ARNLRSTQQPLPWHCHCACCYRDQLRFQLRTCVPRHFHTDPTFQLLILLSTRLADNMTLTSITPHINQMMYELPIVGGDQRRVG
ncbi:hypothetical protein EDB84DRAFT_717850, partial [Lactarius hengduanensis]